MPSFSFVLTEKCDWNCEYCYFTNLPKQKEPILKIFQKHLPYIKEIIDKLGKLVVNIDIQGGEIGLIPVEILEYFFQTFKRPIVVSTNGKFMENGYHINPKIRPYISAIFFHYYDFSGREVKDYDDDIPILRGITHNNIDEMVYFIKQQSNVIFDYVEFEFDINTPNVMDSRMYSMLIQQLLKLKNVSIDAINILRSRLNENLEHRNNCRDYNHSMLIDMVNESICLCQRQIDINIPLTEKNLLYRLKNFPKDIFKENHCDSCTRLYMGKYQGNVIERSLLTRSRI